LWPKGTHTYPSAGPCPGADNASSSTNPDANPGAHSRPSSLTYT